ncbi:MAG: hypothetical protein V3V09_04515, partial [Arenicellales bacterium]
GYLFGQTLVWLLLAFLLGLFLGWLLCGILCRGKRGADDDISTNAQYDGLSGGASTAMASAGAASMASTDVSADASVEAVITDNMRPMALSAPNGTADDLKRIKGIGPVIETTMNELGLFHFNQVADFTPDNVAWVDNYISFPGRIDREMWVSQAKDLRDGVKTEFASRYDRGEVGEENPNS